MIFNLFKGKNASKSKIYTICYISRCDESLKDSDVTKLFNDITQNNIEHNISGVLIHSLGRFFQIIEGSKGKLETLYQKIKLDNRHSEVNELFSKEMRAAYFRTYKSSFSATLDSKEIADVNRYLNDESEYPFAKNISNILKTFEISARIN